MTKSYDIRLARYELCPHHRRFQSSTDHPLSGSMTDDSPRNAAKVLKQSSPAAATGHHAQCQTRTGMPVGKNPERSELLQEEVIYNVIDNHSVAGR